MMTNQSQHNEMELAPERRRFKRHSYPFPIQYNTSAIQALEAAQILNYSEGGMLLETLETFHEGTPLAVHIEIFDKTYIVDTTVLRTFNKTDALHWEIALSCTKEIDQIKMKIFEELIKLDNK